MSNQSLKAIRSVIRSKESLYGMRPTASRSLFAQEITRQQSGRIISQAGLPFQDTRSIGGIEAVAQYNIGQAREVLVQWNSVCLPDVASCNVGCSLDVAGIPEPDCYRLRVTKCASTEGWMMRDCDFLGKEWTEDWAVLFGKYVEKHMQALEENISREGIRSAKMFAGLPCYVPKLSGIKLSDTDNAVLVHPSAVTPDLIYCIKEIGKSQGESMDAILFDGNVMSKLFERAVDESGATTIEGTNIIKFRRINYVNIFEEAINLDHKGDNPLENCFLSVEPTAMFLSNYVDYPNERFVEIGNDGLAVIQFTLPNLPINGNLYMQKSCIEYNGAPYNVYKFKPVVHYDWHMNPTDCHDNQTGITKYRVECFDLGDVCDPTADPCADLTLTVADATVDVGELTIPANPVTPSEGSLLDVSATLHFQSQYEEAIDSFDAAALSAGVTVNVEAGEYDIVYLATVDLGEGVVCEKRYVQNVCVLGCDEGTPKEGPLV